MGKPEDTQAGAEDANRTQDAVDGPEETSQTVDESAVAIEDAIEDAEVIEEPAEEAEPEGAADEADTAEAVSDQQVDPQPETSAPVVSEQQSARAGLVGPVIGGVVAAALGFGLAQVLGPMDRGAADRIAALEAQDAEQSRLHDELRGVQADLATALAASGDDAALQDLSAAVAGTNTRIDDLVSALAGLDGRITALEKRPIAEGLPSAAIEAYEREVAELKDTVAAQRAEAAEMEESAAMTARQALARAAMTRVIAALESGAPYRAALVDLSNATGIATPAALEATADAGAPTLLSLQDSFPGFARQALRAARAGEAETGGSVMNFLKTQLGARSVTPQDGDDADAVLSRAEAALRAGRLTDALAELDALPEVAAAVLTDWRAQAEARQAASAAAEALLQSLNNK